MLYNVVLVSPIQQHESAVSICILPLSWASLPLPYPTQLGLLLIPGDCIRPNDSKVHSSTSCEYSSWAVLLADKVLNSLPYWIYVFTYYHLLLGHQVSADYSELLLKLRLWNTIFLLPASPFIPINPAELEMHTKCPWSLAIIAGRKAL